jgi:hypothetical protein
MDLKEKVISALRAHLKPEYLHIENEHGVSGFVVAPKFRGMSALDRQMLIDKALRGPPNGLSADEMRQVMAIAGLTPAEAQAADARVRVHKVEAKGNSIEVMLHGGLSDAEYVRGALLSLKGVKTTVPKSRPGTEVLAG